MERKDVIGKWELAKTLGFDEEKGIPVFMNREELAEKYADDRQYIIQLNTIWEFTEEGKYVTKILLSKTGLTAEEVKNEGMEIEGDYVIIPGGECNDWKFEDGNVYTCTGMKGEVMGEKSDGWEKVELDEDGLLPIVSGMLYLRKI